MKKSIFGVVCVMCLVLSVICARQYRTNQTVSERAAQTIIHNIDLFNNFVDSEYINGNIEDDFPSEKYSLVSQSEVHIKKISTALDIYTWTNPKKPLVLDGIIFNTDTILRSIRDNRATDKDREDLKKLSEILKLYANRDELVAGIKSSDKYLREKDNIVRLEGNYGIR